MWKNILGTKLYVNEANNQIVKKVSRFKRKSCRGCTFFVETPFKKCIDIHNDCNLNSSFCMSSQSMFVKVYGYRIDELLDFEYLYKTNK